MDAPNGLDELGAVLGPAAVLTDPADLVRYCEPYRGATGTTSAVIRPASVTEVQEVLRWARRHRVRLLPQGAATGLVGASTPPEGDPDGAPLVMSLERLDDEPLIDPVDRTAVVTAGTRLSRLESAAATHGLTLPIDLGADPTIGGMVATNTGGARMLRHGDVRRHVLGVRAVVADAGCTVVDDLVTLRKHNVGPSLSHLFVGSSGTFGVVTHVALDLARLPAARACAWCIPKDAAAALDALDHLERSCGPWLEAFEVLSGEALDAALAHGSEVHPFGAVASPPLSVLVELAGDADVDERLVRALDELAGRGIVSDAVVVDPRSAWMPRHLVSEGLRRTGTVLGLDVSVPRPALPRFRDLVRSRVRDAAPDVLVADFGHWADGGVHCNLVLPPDATSGLVEELRRIVLGTAVHDLGGSFSAEHGVGPHNADWWRATVPEPVRSLVAGVKAVFDPLGILGHPGLPWG